MMPLIAITDADQIGSDPLRSGTQRSYCLSRRRSSSEGLFGFPLHQDDTHVGSERA